MAGSRHKDGELIHYLQIILRGKWILLGVFILVTGAGYLYTSRLDPVYRATVSILIEREAARVVDAREVVSLGEDRDYYSYYNTQLSILESRDIAARALERLGDPMKLFPPADNGAAGPRRPPTDAELERYAGRLAGLVRVEPSRNSRLVRLSIEHGDPEMAALAANTLAEVFVDENLARRMRATGDAQHWLLHQIREAEQRLQDSERALSDYRRRHEQVSLDQSQNVIISRLEQLNSAFTQAQAARVEAEAQYNNYVREAEQIEVSVPEVFDSEFVESLRASLARLENERHRLRERYPAMISAHLRGALAEREAEQWRLRERYTATHPEMVRISREIEELRELIEQENRDQLARVEGEINELQAQIEKETQEQRARMLRELEREKRVSIANRTREYRLSLEATRDRENELRRLLREQEEEALSLSDKAVDYSILSRDVQTRRELYQMLLRQAQEVDLTGEITANNISILDRARVPGGPIRPNPMRNMAMSVMLGLVLGTGMVFFSDYLDDQARDFDDISEAFGTEGLRLLSTVPHLKPPHKYATLEKIVSGKDADHHATNAFRMLRTNLLFPAPEKPQKSILVTSSISGEGKTLVTCNLAIAFAQIGSRVLIIDADLHKPQLERVFDLKDRTGLGDYLAGAAGLEEIIHDSGVPNLSVIPVGTQKLDSEQLIASGAILELGALVREKFDYVFYDSPPLMLMPDASFLNARLAEATIMVTRAGRTPRRVFARAAQMLREAKGAALSGVVFNDAGRRVGSSYYKYEYYYGYRNK